MTGLPKGGMIEGVGMGEAEGRQHSCEKTLGQLHLDGSRMGEGIKTGNEHGDEVRIRWSLCWTTCV